MPLASTSRTQLRYVLEAAYGVTPTTGNHNAIRVTGESLDFSIKTETSKEIRSDRQTTDLVQVGAGATGGFNFEFSYKEFDPFLEAALQGTFLAAGTGGVNVISATFTATTITAGSGTPFVNMVDGQWIKVSGASVSANNGYFKILTKTSSTVLTFAAATFTAEGPTANVNISSSRLVNGTTQRSYTIEKNFSDITQFLAYRGMTASKLSLNFQSGSIVNGTIDFMGKDMVRAGTTALPGTTTASSTYDIMNAVSGVGNVLEGGAPLSGTFIKKLDFNFDNALRAQDAIGTLGAVGIAPGTIMADASMDIYFANGTIYDKFLNNTSSSLSFRSVDGAGNGYIFTFPKTKFGEAKVTAGAINQDAMLVSKVTALMDATTSQMVQIDRVGVAV